MKGNRKKNSNSQNSIIDLTKHTKYLETNMISILTPKQRIYLIQDSIKPFSADFGILFVSTFVSAQLAVL